MKKVLVSASMIKTSLIADFDDEVSEEKEFKQEKELLESTLGTNLREVRLGVQDAYPITIRNNKAIDSMLDIADHICTSKTPDETYELFRLYDYKYYPYVLLGLIKGGHATIAFFDNAKYLIKNLKRDGKFKQY